MNISLGESGASGGLRTLLAAYAPLLTFASTPRSQPDLGPCVTPVVGQVAGGPRARDEGSASDEEQPSETKAKRTSREAMSTATRPEAQRRGAAERGEP